MSLIFGIIRIYTPPKVDMNKGSSRDGSSLIYDRSLPTNLHIELQRNPKGSSVMIVPYFWGILAQGVVND